MKKVNYFIMTNIFFVFNILSFIDMFLLDLRVGLLSSILVAVVLMINYKYFNLLLKSRNFPFALYLIICVLSIAGYIVNGRPVELYFKAISYNLLPSMLYVIGMIGAYKKINILQSLVYSNSILLLLGLLIYFIAPEFYWESFYAAGGSLLRFGSYIGSIQVGNIAVASIPLILSKDSNVNNNLKTPMILISIISIILSAQRSAYINLVIIIFAILFVNIKIIKNIFTIEKIKVFFLFLIGGKIIIEIFNNLISDTLKKYFLIRIIKIDDTMISARSGQWLIALDYFEKFPLGMGLGAGGDKASSIGMLLIPDGNYFRILVELGILGIISFIGINMVAIFNKSANIYLKIALFSYLTSAVGSNVFDLFYSSFMYWVLLGYMVNSQKLTKYSLPQ